MEILLLNKITLSAVSILVVFILSILIKSKAKQTQEKRQLSKARYYTLKRFINIFTLILIAGIFTLVWGIDIKNIWVSVTSILAMVAVAFFAVWSLIGNILAGIILFFTSPFKTNDTIEIVPDEIKGKVVAINAFFTLIADEEDNLINIPNSLLFQRYIKKFKKKNL